jgi:tripartite-type tricarboxylate transporter receptor subunit TctC
MKSSFHTVRAAMASFALLFCVAAQAQVFPSQPIRLMIGTPPGGVVDLLGRALGEGMSAHLGTPVVPITSVGANGTIAVAQVARSPADGYTVGFTGAGPFVSQPFMRNDLPFSTADIDFLCQVFELPVALVVPVDSPFRTLDDFVASAKARPGQVNVGHGGLGSVPQLAIAELEKAAQIKLNQVAYKGDADQTTAVMGKHLDAAVPGLSSVANKPVRVLATFAAERADTHPDVPTVKESGYGVVKVGMIGLYTRKGVPSPAREKLVAACKAGAESDVYRRASAKSGQSVKYLGPEQWSARISEDAQQNKRIVEALR